MKLNNLKISSDLKKKLQQSGSLKSVEFINSKSGIPTIKKNNILIHSAYDPLKEAENLINSLNLDKNSNYLIIALGVGLGYHVKMLKTLYPNSVIIPIELDDDIALAFSNQNDDFIITNHNLNDIYTVLNFIDFMTIRDIKFIYLPSLYRISKEDYDKIANDIADIVKSKFTDLLTRVNFDKLWVKNALLNITYLFNYGSLSQKVVKHNFEDFLNKPFVVMGAGYSANFVIDEIKKYRDKVVLCVVDTALKPILNYDIKPDFVFSLDSQFANIKDFFGIETKDLTLLADIVVSPELVRNFKGDIFFTKSSHIEVLNGVVYEITNNVISWIEGTIGYNILGLESGGSVSTNLFHFALMMGGNPTFLVGVDLGFPYLVSHLKGSPHHEYFTIKGNTFSTSDTFSVSSILREYVLADGIKDEKCITHKIMQTYKLWFDSASDTSNLSNVYNISDGVKLKGITNLSTNEGRNLIKSILSNMPNIKRKNILIHDEIEKDRIKEVSKELWVLKSKIIDLINEVSQDYLNDIVSEYPFVLNVVSKSLFPFFRGQKEFDNCVEDVIKDLKWFVKIISFVENSFS